MTKRYFGSLLIGVIVGLAIGVYVGWEQYPVEYTNSDLSGLAPRYQEEYTVMVAEGYQHDGDVNAALDRLRALGKENVFDYVQDLTERFITQSNVPSIPPMVALVEGLGLPLTAPMELYRSTPSTTRMN